MGTHGNNHNPSRPIPARTRAPRTQAADGPTAEAAAAHAYEVAGLRAAMETRATIAQAQGMLMARHGLSAETAFAVLVRLSQRSNIKLRDIAARMVETAPSDWERQTHPE